MSTASSIQPPPLFSDPPATSGESLDATILLATRDVPAQMVPGLGRGFLEFRVRESLPLGGRHRFWHQGAGYGVTVTLARITVCRASDDGSTTLWAAPRAVYARDGEAALRRFLARVLHIAHPVAERVSSVSGRWFYRFTDTPIRLVEPSGETRRREERINVRTPVRVSGRGGPASGVVYNVSRSGLFVATTGDVPPVGGRLVVDYPIAAGVPVRLDGEVMWSAPATVGLGGGVGLRLHGVDDGADGAAWDAYVDALARFDAVA